jgi:hypothetical protein
MALLRYNTIPASAWRKWESKKNVSRNSRCASWNQYRASREHMFRALPLDQAIQHYRALYQYCVLKRESFSHYCDWIWFLSYKNAAAQSSNNRKHVGCATATVVHHKSISTVSPGQSFTLAHWDPDKTLREFVACLIMGQHSLPKRGWILSANVTRSSGKN